MCEFRKNGKEGKVFPSSPSSPSTKLLHAIIDDITAGSTSKTSLRPLLPKAQLYVSVQLLPRCRCCLCPVVGSGYFSCYHGAGAVCVQMLAVGTLSVQLLPQCRCCLCPVVGSGCFSCYHGVGAVCVQLLAVDTSVVTTV